MKKAKTKGVPPARRSKSKRGGGLAWILGAGVCLAAGMWFLNRGPQPPSVNLASADPAIATLISTARTAVVRAPKSAGAWGKLGQAFHATEFHAEARVCYSNASVLDPKAFRWPYLLGLLEMNEHPDAALEKLARATELAGGQSTSPRYELARALVERGQFEQAAPHLNMLIAANPQHAAARVALARVYLSRNALREATLELEGPLTNSYTMRAALLLAAQIAQRNNQAEVAAMLTQRATALPRSFDWPDPVQREVQRLRSDRAQLADQANLLLQQQRLPEAEAALNKLLQARPDDPEGLLLLGRLRYVEKKCSVAEALLRRHLAAQPDSLNGLIQLGLALLCQKQWTNAAVVLERAIALKPDFVVAHNNLGLARSQSGDTAGAIRAYRDALRCNPGDINIHISLAEELANAGQLAAARLEIESAAALNPKDPRLEPARAQLEQKP